MQLYALEAAILIASSAVCRHLMEKPRRRRPVAEVVKEIVQVQRLCVQRTYRAPFKGTAVAGVQDWPPIRVGLDDGGIVAFVDDLHNSNRAYCRELWAALNH